MKRRRQRRPGPAVVVPRGWSALVTAGALPPHLQARCARCGLQAVALLADGPRCGHHPPQPGEWGSGLDWTPPPLGDPVLA